MLAKSAISKNDEPGEEQVEQKHWVHSQSLPVSRYHSLYEVNRGYINKSEQMITIC